MKKNKNQNNRTFKSKNFVNVDDEIDLNSETQKKKWFEEIIEDPKKFKPVSEQILIELKDEAKMCLNSEVANYNIKNTKTNSNYQWMKTIMSKGTVSDKIAAHTVAIQDNPVCTLEMLQTLINMVKVGKKKECMTVIDTLTELFLTDLLKPEQNLKAFHQRPLSCLSELSSGNAVTRRKLLSYWYFEDKLKELYTYFVVALNNIAHDTIDANKEKAISSMYKLLAGNPEQEKNLLAHIVNKLGDPSQKVASKAIYSLSQLLYKHPNMQGVVLKEVEKLLFRSNVSFKAQYYGLCFLSQFYLSHDTNEIAKRLIEVYFSFFKACVKKGEIDSRMMSALLMGVNRAYPYAKIELEKIADHLDTLYRIVHIASFNNSLHALTLLYQVSDSESTVSDRFYSALYKKLFDPKLLTTTHQALLLSLIYKSILRDSEIARVKVFIKRLLQLALFIQPSFACGILYLISQLTTKKTNIQSFILKRSKLNNEEDENDEERYYDVKNDNVENNIKEDTKETEDEDIKPDINVLNASLSQSSWYHQSNSVKKNILYGYNPLSRNPLYAGGELCAYSELIHLKSHFHPTVSLYASNLLEGEVIKYSGDPLKDFTLIRFLDRFVFKNPKKVDQTSVKGAHPTFGKRKMYQPKGLRLLPVNSISYLNENLKNIPVDELFMYSYLQKKYKDKKLKEHFDEEDSDLESVQSEEFEEMLDKMAGKSKDDNDLDFLNDIGGNLKQKKNKKNVEEEEEIGSDANESEDLSVEDNEELSDENLDDFDMNEEDEELLQDLSSDDEEDITFDEDDKVTKGKKKKGKNDDIKSLFASAEEFASLLDEEGSSKCAPGSSNELSNKDNADVKQLAWEDKRNRWLKGFNKATGSIKMTKNKNIGKKRSKHNQFGNKGKKIRNK